FGAMMNIGVRPTLQNGTQRHIEVHLFGFEGNLYAQLLKLDMVFRIRSEIKFSDLESLKKQIQNDREVSVHWLRTHYPDLPVPV
ncbi:MAG TPA: riboflavin kinase, partial [Chitinophagaceae bacterium]|nr:riboflavin kinase [Chitinophagaceae bacterium]